MIDVVMPRLSDSMEEGTVLRWLKQVGDEVRRGDELVEIETDKANMVYEATDEGTLVEIVAQEGDTLPIGETIARIGAADETSAQRAASRDEGAAAGTPPPGSPDSASEGPPAATPAPTLAQDVSAPPTSREREGERLKASPIARRMARERGVELDALQGSGPGGRIVKADVEAAAGAPPPEPPTSPVEGARGEAQVIELTKIQATIARRMAESKATVPHFYLQNEIDMSEAVKVREQLKQMAVEGSPVPTYNDMVVKASALGLREFPRANGAYRDGRIEQYPRINVGVAVASQDALVVPTIFDADRKSLGEIAAEAGELAAKVRGGTITPPELSGGTFTVSNLGMFGVTNFAAVINPPQAALLSVGAIQQKPVVDAASGEIAARPLMGVTLACDHRILYGADGARLLARIRELLEQPMALSL